MTIDEAIAQAERIAEGQEKSAELSPSNHAKERISKSAAEHRQLAEWLTELKELREKVSGGDVLRICQLEEREKEYKRLLKAAVEDVQALAKAFAEDEPCNSFTFCSECPLHVGRGVNCIEWRFKTEALDLIGGENDED